MDYDLPGIVVTGASGFVGRHFLASAAGRYRLFCLARRSRREAGVPADENLRWTQVDIANWDGLREVVKCVKDHGGADFVLHLAGYYDFQQMEHPEYERTNVHGTRNVLKLASQLGVKRFLFASSLAACEFPTGDDMVDEDTPPDAEFAYARSKRRGEELVREHLEWTPAAILRLAAVYSDWCEYPPVYVFLNTWLSRAWNSRILGGRGDSAVTYIHIRDLMRLIHRVIEINDRLPRLGVYNASPCHTTSHNELFASATRYFFGSTPPPMRMPKWLAAPGVRLRWWAGRLLGSPPFEAPWMVRYIDRQLRVDSSRTQAELGWEPSPRLDISRRLLVMIENMKSHREAWRLKNDAALHRVGRRPNLIISEVLTDLREDMVERIVEAVSSPENAGRFCRYADMERDELRWFITLLYQVLATSVRTRDRRLVRRYARMIAVRRKREGFTAAQVQDFLATVGGIIGESLRIRPELADLSQQIHDNVSLSFQLALDGVEDAFERMQDPDSGFIDDFRDIDLPSGAGDLEQMVRQLENICDESLPARLRNGI